jgi:photosystem II stability/assembly factor-like uncharacterized protein
MDTTTRNGRLSPRARRALPLIVAAVLVAAAASAAYLQPSLLQLPKPAPGAKGAGPAELSNDYSATFAFVTPSLAWALVAETTSLTPRFSVFKTTDAAKHWKRQLIRQPNLISLDSLMVRFFDPSHGVIAVGDPTEIYRTSDGGTHWALVKTPDYPHSSFVPADTMHGWLMGWTGPPDQTVPILFSTSDGGDTWTALPKTGYQYGNLSFRNSREGWFGAGAAEPTVYSSLDGGASWQAHALPSSQASNLCPDPLPPGTEGPLWTYVSLLPGRGVLVILSDNCGHDQGYTSVDGGTWRPLASPPGTTSLWDFAYQDSSHWWAMRLGDLWKSSDAGHSWKLVSQQIDGWEYLPHIIDANHAWAELFTSTSGQAPDLGLAVTSDGGLHWSQVSTPTPG